MLLALAAAIGVPVSALAYFFLYFVSYLQKLIFVQLPVDVGFKGEPVWWPLPILMVSGLLVASCITYLPGTSGHSPADGFQFGGGAPSAVELPGVGGGCLGHFFLSGSCSVPKRRSLPSAVVLG